jgi:antitoxin (DNA-binding transcriptional repressor) of toxin-antitoxin stability system
MTEPPRRIDVTRLPDDVVELLDALAPGAHLVITRDGEPIATISSTRPVPAATGEPPADHPTVLVVATAMRLSAPARAALSAELGPGYIVLDLRAAPPTADVVLVPPASPQLIGSMRAQFPKARIVVTEIDDDELGVSYRGPVGRMLDAGAEAYLAPAGVPRLAAQLDHAVHRPRPVAGADGRPELDAGAPPA